VRGELGWERQKARRDEMRLAKLVRMEDDRIAKKIYKASKERLANEQERKKQGEEVIMTKTWCKYTKELLQELELEETWHSEEVAEEKEWNELIREKIHEREQIQWRTACLLRPKLRTYVNLWKCITEQASQSS